MIYVTGDTHGDYDWSKLNTTNWPEQKSLNKSDYLIICGDVAVRWFDTRPYGSLHPQDKYIIEWYENKPFTTLFVDGNHENFNALYEYPVTEWNGGKVHQISDSVYHLMRGQVFTIDGKTFFTMGGAASIDKYRREENVSWWDAEMPNREELEEGIANLEKYNFKVDYVVTHCCGTSLIPALLPFGGESDTLTSYFDHLELDFKLDFTHWYFGHYHKDRQIDSKHTCLYQNVEKLDDSPD